jgi:hypothetical protein
VRQLREVRLTERDGFVAHTAFGCVRGSEAAAAADARFVTPWVCMQ